MPDKPSEADILVNRLAIQAAQQRSLLQSQASRPPTTSTALPADDDEDFEGLDEDGGLGSKRKADDEWESLAGAFKRTKALANNDLLEKLIGKKAANAKRQERESTKVGGGHKAVKALGVKEKVRQKKHEDSEDEEEGRGAAFKSKKSRKPNVVEPVREVEEATNGHTPYEEGAEDEPERTIDSAPSSKSETESRPSKRKAGSYLDELLTQNASKKSKKKKKKTAPSTT